MLLAVFAGRIVLPSKNRVRTYIPGTAAEQQWNIPRMRTSVYVARLMRVAVHRHLLLMQLQLNPSAAAAAPIVSWYVPDTLGW